MSLASALLLAAAAPAGAAFADLDAIDRQVAAFAGAATTPVDRRLRLNRCGAPLAMSWRTARRDAVVVQCPDAGGWRLFVPVAVAAAGQAEPPVVNRGEMVTIAASGEGFTVSQSGEALESGAAGAWIRVRVARPGTAATAAAAQPLRGRVVRPGLVVVPVE